MKAQPLVSICIPTYNGEKFLREALESIEAQTYKNIEVIISDDHSKDKTLEICEEFKRAVLFPVHIYSHFPSGIGANWNNSVKYSNGDYIKFLFQDDLLESDCLEIMLYFIKKHRLLAVCSKRAIMDTESNNVTTGNWYEEFFDLQKRFLNLEFRNFYILTKKDLKKLVPHYLTRNIFGEPIAFLFDKSIFSEVGFFNTEFRQVLDIEFSYRILKNHSIGIIEEKLFKFRIHDEQASSVNSQSKFQVLENNKLEDIVFKNFFWFLPIKNVVFYLRRKSKIINVFFHNFYKLKSLFKK